MYLDNNATTATDPRVLVKMLPYFTEKFGNPSSKYSLGEVARDAISDATTHIQNLLNAKRPGDTVIFNGSATESLNHVVRGLFEANGSKGHLITQKTEHASHLELVEKLEKWGCEVTILDVDENGIVDLAQLRFALEAKRNTFLVSIMYANNETGVVQPIKKITELIRSVKQINKVGGGRALFHSDASHPVGKVAIDFAEEKIDYLTLSGHKIYTPKGIGALVMSEHAASVLPQFILGGKGQAGGKRASTENVPYIVALGEACRLAEESLGWNFQLVKEKKLRDKFEKLLEDRLGADFLKVLGGTVQRTPTTASVGFYGVEANALLERLLERGVLASGTSACQSGLCKKGVRPTSHVVEAMGNDENFGVVRFSLGRTTTEDEVSEAVEIICKAVEEIRGLEEIRKEQRLDAVEEIREGQRLDAVEEIREEQRGGKKRSGFCSGAHRVRQRQT